MARFNMMDHDREQSKVEPEDGPSEPDQKPRSYYYDDATNYETYRDEEDDDDEPVPSDNVGD